MPTVTKFIIALCPATPVYVHAHTGIPNRAEGKYATRNRAEARVFETFDAAQQVAKSIRGWGGAQRVEEISVEAPEVPSLATPAGRIEARDAATFAWHEANEQDELPTAAAVQALRDLGYRAASEDGDKINVADPEGNLLDLEWDPGVDGFDYATSGDDGCDLDEIEAQHEDEPETCTCDGCDEEFAEAEVTVCTGGADIGDFVYCKGCLSGAGAPHAEAPTAQPLTPTQQIERALRGLRSEEKIVALVTALVESGVTLGRAADPGDGSPCVFATLPDGSTCAVISL